MRSGTGVTGTVARTGKARERSDGQAAIELAITFPIVFALVVLIVEIGFAFHTYLTLTEAARHGAKAGAVYLFDHSVSADPAAALVANDQNRVSGTGTSTPYQDNVRATVAGVLARLGPRSAGFDRNAHVTVSYTPAVASNDTRKGDLITVRVVFPYRFLTGVFTDATISMHAEATEQIE